MLRISILLSVLLLSFKSFGQMPPCPITQTVVASNDTVVCNGGCVPLWAQGTTDLKGTLSYSQQSIPYTPQPFVGTTILNYSNIDDTYGDLLPIPFPFCYFGVQYNSCTMGANGQVSFNAANANSACPYNITTGLPGQNNAATLNCIMGPYYDLYPGQGGTVSTAVYGVAPCREFVLSWSNVQLYSTNTCPGLLGTHQIILHESTNVITINVQNKPLCTNWIGGRGILGIEDNIGAVANVNFYTAPGRNGVPFGTTNESWRYIPTGVPTEQYIWRDSATNAVVGNGATISVCPTQPTTYIVEYQISCPIFSVFETVHVGMGVADTIENFTKNDPTMCGAKNGYITLSSMIPGDTFQVYYDINGLPQPPQTIIVASDGTITISGLDTGTYDDIYIKTLTGCESNHVGPLTLINPAFSVNFDTLVMRGCEVDSIQFIDQSVGVTQYAWDFGDGNNGVGANPLHTYQDQGIYNITMVGTNGFCTDQKSLSVDLIHPIDADFSVSEDSICNGETIFFTDNSVSHYTATYTWNFGDGATANTPSTAHQYTTDGVYNATLTIVDLLSCVSVESQEIVVASIAVEIGPQDTTVCLVDSMMLYSRTTNPPYFGDGIEYSWSPTAHIGSPNEPQTNFYTEVPGDYTYVLTATGLPMNCIAKDTLTIHIEPRPVLINVTPDQVIKYGSSVQLHAEGVLYYIWTPPATLDNANIPSPVGTPTEPTVYTVYGMNENGGCRDTAEVVIGIDYNMQEFVPTVFSPNGDGKNDVFRILNMKFQKLVEFRVFNRWGKELYSTTDATKGWDGTFNGTPQDPDAYSYIIRVTLPDGGTRVYKGSITLIR
jgi:gliding motility-associated-like protein